mgnify:CR=1 FL=1
MKSKLWIAVAVMLSLALSTGFGCAKKKAAAEAEKAAEDIKRQAEAAVLAELEDAKRVLREEVAEQAAAMAEELIVKNLTSADQVAITEQYLERVGAVQ